MVQFYLLIRATNEFARRYGDEIKKVDDKSILTRDDIWSVKKKKSTAGPSSTMSSISDQPEPPEDGDNQSQVDSENNDDGKDKVNEKEAATNDSGTRVLVLQNLRIN